MFLLLVCSTFVFSQSTKLIDSLLSQVAIAENDTLKIDLLNSIASQFQNSDLKRVQFYGDNALKLALKIDYPNGKVKAYFNLGNLNYIKGNYSLTLNFYTKALKVLEQENNQKGVASALMGIGNVHGIIGDFEKAIDYQEQSLAIRLELNDSLGMAGSYNNLGSIYTDLEEYETSLDYHFKALDIKIDLKHYEGMSSSYGNIGSVYSKLGRYVEALEYQKKALEIREDLNNKKGMAMSYTDIGNIYSSLGDFDLALQNQWKSLEIAREVGFGNGVVNALFSISSTYEKLEEPIEALAFYKQYKVAQDSLFTINKAAEMAKIESQYESEKQELEITNLNKEKKISAIELTQQKRKNYYMYSGLIAVFIIAFLILIAFFNKRKANKLIQEQKKRVEVAKGLIEEKQEEILDSIYYAKHIQNAILPSKSFIKENLPNSFVFYQPKSIVAGDFYWMETLSSLEGGLKVGDKHPSNSPQGDNLILFAAADCTGHGVPGAIVSVVCHNALNRSLREYNLTKPGEILEKTNELVEDAFSKSVEKVHDGMDIALCVIDLNKKELEFAGAKNPLWIVRKGANKIEEIIATPRPIGFHDREATYKTNKVTFNAGDRFYMFSDGFQDQFGGLKGKKYKQGKFKKLLLEISSLPMESQEVSLQKEFENWKGSIDQIDDICVVGFKL